MMIMRWVAMALVAGFALWFWLGGCQKSESVMTREAITGMQAQLAERVAVASRLEELCEIDTLVLRPPTEVPLVLVDCIHIDQTGRYLVTQSTSAARGVYRFRADGAFDCRIGSIGEGPGEYLEPTAAVTDSLGRVIIYDAGLRRISIFDSTAEFVRSFEPEIAMNGKDVGLAVATHGQIALNPRDVYPLDRPTVIVYTEDGRYVSSFAGLSPEAMTVRRRMRMNFATPGPHLVLLDGCYFLTDFATYKIRKYDSRGRLLQTFGVPPRGWKSLADADYSKYPRASVATPSVMRKLKRFDEEEIAKCSLVLGIQRFGGRFLLQRIVHGKRSGVVPREVFLVYDTHGQVLNDHLVLRSSPVLSDDHTRYLVLGTPEGLFIVEELEDGRARLVYYYPRSPAEKSLTETSSGGIFVASARCWSNQRDGLMFRARSPQKELFDPAQQFGHLIKKNSLYMLLAKRGEEFIKDEDFLELYSIDRGRPSVPPSILIRALLLQMYDRVSDAEATRRARVDLSWKIALGIPEEKIPFTKSTLQLFRTRLLVTGKIQWLFNTVVQRLQEIYQEETSKHGRRRRRLALDTTPVDGKGAVKDAFNMLADLIHALVIHVASALGRRPAEWARENGFGKYFGKSFKGMCRINWDDPAEREALLAEVVADADRIRELAHSVLDRGQAKRLPQKEQSQFREQLKLLDTVLAQNVERGSDGSAKIKQGVDKDRVVSPTDAEMRHGRKSASQPFDGYKLGVAVDTETGVVTAVAVKPGNVHDGTFAEELVAKSEEATGEKVGEILGDTAFGDAASRARWEAQGVKVTARIARAPDRGGFGKADFEVDPGGEWVKCPAGEVSHQWRKAKVTLGGEVHETKRFVFSAQTCRQCRFYDRCVGARGGGKSITLHPFEAELRRAREEQQTEAFRRRYRERVVVEHRIARMMQLGMRKARYLGREKVQLQALLVAMVANLTLVLSRQAKGNAASSFFLAAYLHLWLFFLAECLFNHYRIRPHSLSHRLNRTTPPLFRPGF